MIAQTRSAAAVTAPATVCDSGADAQLVQWHSSAWLPLDGLSVTLEQASPRGKHPERMDPDTAFHRLHCLACSRWKDERPYRKRARVRPYD